MPKNTVHLTMTEARRLVDVAITKWGPTTTRQCLYTVGNVPHCIVAVALSEAGVPSTTLAALSGSIDLPFNAAWLREHANVEITPAAAEYLCAVQSEQDHGRTWGRARWAAERLLGLDETVPPSPDLLTAAAEEYLRTQRKD